MKTWKTKDMHRLIKKGDFSKDTYGQPAIVTKVTGYGVHVVMCCGEEKFIETANVGEYSFYDYSTLEIIEPPVPREIIDVYFGVYGASMCYVTKDGHPINFHNKVISKINRDYKALKFAFKIYKDIFEVVEDDNK